MSEKVLNKVRKIAKIFSLRYNRNVFRINYLPKRELAIISYLGGNPDFSKFGNNIEERTNNIEDFLKSQEFKKEARKQSGCVTNSLIIAKYIKSIKNQKVKKYCEIILKALDKNKDLILVSKPTNFKERKFTDTIILHEYLHALLNYNNVKLQKKKKEYWKLDEALVKYLTDLKV